MVKTQRIRLGIGLALVTMALAGCTTPPGEQQGVAAEEAAPPPPGDQVFYGLPPADLEGLPKDGGWLVRLVVNDVHVRYDVIDCQERVVGKVSKDGMINGPVTGIYWSQKGKTVGSTGLRFTDDTITLYKQPPLSLEGYSAAEQALRQHKKNCH